MSCQGAVTRVESAMPAASMQSAAATTRRMPHFSMSAAAKGATRP